MAIDGYVLSKVYIFFFERSLWVQVLIILFRNWQLRLLVGYRGQFIRFRGYFLSWICFVCFDGCKVFVSFFRFCFKVLFVCRFQNWFQVRRFGLSRFYRMLCFFSLCFGFLLGLVVFVGVQFLFFLFIGILLVGVGFFQRKMQGWF